MSFSSDVKHEICQVGLDGAQNKAQLCALFLMRATMNLTSSGTFINFQTENAAIAKHAFSIIKEAYSVPVKLSVLKKMNLKKNNIYQLAIFGNCNDILSDLTILRSSGLCDRPAYQLTRSDKNARAFLQGCFLCGGSINHPKTTNYHMEISFSTKNLAEHVLKLMERFDMPCRMIERKGSFVVYMKAGDKIADFLRLMGTTACLFEFEDTRIQRDFLNQIKRLDNCEVANEVKSQKAGARQIEWIELIEKNMSRQAIPEKIAQVMEIRKSYPDASVVELCDEMAIRYGTVISKSGMKHRLGKIKEMALQIEESKTAQKQKNQQ